MADRNCEKFSEIAMAKAESDDVSKEDEVFFIEHMNSCPHCRLQIDVEDILRYDLHDPHVEQLDELSRKRLVDEIINKAIEKPVDSAAEHGPAGAVERAAWRMPLVAAAAVLLIVLGSVLYLLRDKADLSEEGTVHEKPATVAARDAKVLMVHGNIRSGGSYLTADSMISYEREIEVEDGSMALAVSDAILLMVKNGSRFRLTTAGTKGTDVFLSRGSILASIEPGKAENGFSVSTMDGVISVTGTVFSVSASDNHEVDVNVLRGSVRVERKNHKIIQLRAMQGILAGDDRPRNLTAREEETAWAEVRLLEKLSVSGGATISIDSVPKGADVAIEGIIMGRTPLILSAHPGYRKMDLTLEGYTPVRERLEIREGMVVSRVFELRPVKETVRQKSAGNIKPPIKAEKAEPAHELLKRARALRSFQDWKGAAQAYARLIELYPSSSEAKSAYVSIGLIYLDHLGRPVQAMKNFNEYLAASPGGALAPEAAFGRARALRSLNRLNEEETALENFIRAYPDSLQAPQAEARLSRIRR